MTEPLHALPGESIRARRRPAAIALVYVWEACLALVVATPVHAWARRAWGGHPDGDALLWRPGARELLVWLGQNDAALPVVSRTVMILLFVGALASQLALGALLVSLAFSRERDSTRPPAVLAALRAATSAFLPLATLLVLLGITVAVIVGAGGMLASALDPWLTRSFGDARSFQIRLVIVVLFTMLAAVAGVFGDLARAAAGREAGLASQHGTAQPAWNVMLRGVRVAMLSSRAAHDRGLLGATAAWSWRAAAGLALLAIGYAASTSLGGRGGGALVLLAILHQLVVLARVSLRASWLAAATRRILPAQDALLTAPSPDAPPPALPAPIAPEPERE